MTRYTVSVVTLLPNGKVNEIVTNHVQGTVDNVIYFVAEKFKDQPHFIFSIILTDKANG